MLSIQWRNKCGCAAYRSAIESGLQSCLSNVEFTQSPVTPELLKQKKADIAVSVNIQNENLSLTCSEVMGFFSSGIRQNAQFQISFGMTFADTDGSILYSFTANGASFDTKDLPCSEIAQMMASTMEKGLKQAADNTSQLVYGNSELKEYSNKKRK